MSKGKPARWIMRKEGNEPLKVKMVNGRPVRITKKKHYEKNWRNNH